MARDTDPGVDARVVRTRHDVLRTAIQVLLDEGREALTHAHVAALAGYSKATVYAHWPTRADLVRDAFTHFGDMQHHTPSGDLRADLVAELVAYRRAMVEQRLDRAMAVLSDLSHSVPGLAGVRDQLVVDGERVVRQILAPRLQGTDLDAATLMLCGAMLHSALLYGDPPGDDLIAAAVDLVLGGRVPDGAGAQASPPQTPASAARRRPGA